MGEMAACSREPSNTHDWYNLHVCVHKTSVPRSNYFLYPMKYPRELKAHMLLVLVVYKKNIMIYKLFTMKF